MHYDPDSAEIYASLRIRGTTYEIGYSAVAELLSYGVGGTWVDLGCGAGRSARFLQACNVASRILAIDHSLEMLQRCGSGLSRIVADADRLPIRSGSIAGLTCQNMLIEVDRYTTLRRVMSEISRVLAPGGLAVLVTGNPAAVGRPFTSFEYRDLPPSLASGTRITCHVKSPAGTMQIPDTYWTVRDYIEAVESTELVIADNFVPTIPEGHIDADLEDGRSDGPFLVLACQKGSATDKMQ